MRHQHTNIKIVTLPASRDFTEHRFRALLGEDWNTLPAAVRARFGKRPLNAKAVTYKGEVIAYHANLAGRLLAQACRIIGAPLPLENTVGLAAVVSVIDDHGRGSQHWTRIYGRKGCFPQVIQSSKRFCGPTGLEEYLGLGFGMSLRVSACDQGLRFVSDHYFWNLGRLRLRFPRWLAPGKLTISHIDNGNGRFIFDLVLEHTVFGCLLQQTAEFTDDVG